MLYDYTKCKKKEKRIQNQECIYLDIDRDMCKINNKECIAIEKIVDNIMSLLKGEKRLYLKSSKVIESKKKYDRKKFKRIEKEIEE